LLDVTAFGALVRQKRGQKRLTQETLAIDVFGESTRKGDISRIENGRVTPQEATVQKLCAALEISDAEMAPIRQSRPSARQLDEIPALSRDELQILASRFRHPAPYDADDPELREYLTGKAEEFRAYRATIDALDDRVAAIANLKGAAQDAAAKLDFDEVEILLSRVDEVETEIAAETKVARAQNALLRNDPDTAFTILSAAADSFASIDPLEPARKRGSYEDLLYQHGLRYPGPALDLAARMNHDALGIAPRDTDAPLWAALQINLQNNLGNALHQDLGTRAGDTDALRTPSPPIAPRWRSTPCCAGGQPDGLGHDPEQPRQRPANLGTRAGDTDALLQDAVTAYRAALEVYTREASPMDWAMTQNNLGNALRDLGTRAGDTAALQDAVTAYRAALEVYTREASPMDWAMTQNNLGNALATSAPARATPTRSGRRHRLPRRAGGPHARGRAVSACPNDGKPRPSSISTVPPFPTRPTAPPTSPQP
jgi:transcriptional regulator with XRE-family HTH domain